MSSTFSQLNDMLVMVASALGEDLLNRVVFVGGCTTGLLVTDDFTKEGIRYTDDVDLIIDIIGYTDWAKFQEQLREKGFRVSMDDEVICRMRLGELKVDFMPDDEDILGFTNIWYAKAIEHAQDYALAEELSIRLVSPPFFVATKLEAYLGRGNDDPMLSHDLEDLLNLVDGREELVPEIRRADDDVRAYIADQINRLMEHSDFEYAVQGNVRGDTGRSELIYERLEAMKAGD